MKFRRILCTLLVVTVLFAVKTALAQERTHDHHPDHIIKAPADMQWQDGPASLPEGSQYSLIEGDWTKEGPFTTRLKLPADYVIPPHWHPAIEHVTVIKGSFHMGLGETFDRDKAQELPIGGFSMMNIGVRHYAFTTEETIIQLHGIGPWGITYVKEEDDPRLAGGQ
jgi:hypothetical protein